MKRQQQDYFGTYLKTVKGAESATSSEAEPEQAAEISPVDLLRILENRGRVDLADLQRESALPFQRFYEILNRLQEAGLIQVAGDPGAEHADITPAGRSLAQLER